MKIWLDDERERPDESWTHFLTSAQVIKLLNLFKKCNLTIESMSLDHDLGGEDTTRPVVLWMCENEYWPERIFVHTANPVGRIWLEGMCDGYGPGISR